VFLDPAQSMTHSIRMAKKHFGDAAHRRITVLPHPECFEQYLAFVVGEAIKPDQYGSN
jgi:hypothetical protein